MRNDERVLGVRCWVLACFPSTQNLKPKTRLPFFTHHCRVHHFDISPVFSDQSTRSSSSKSIPRSQAKARRLSSVAGARGRRGRLRRSDTANLREAAQDVFVEDGVAAIADVAQEVARLFVA